MVATVDKAPRIAKDGRIMFRDPRKNTVIWRQWEDMDTFQRDYVRENYPAYVPDGEANSDNVTGEYDEWIAYYESRIEECRRVFREGRDGVERGQARSDAVQYAQAIENLREANQLPESADAWFAVIPGEFRAYLPPVLPVGHIDYIPDWYVQTVSHVARLSSRPHIAWMRRLMREGRDPNRRIFERTDDAAKRYYPRINEHGELLGWSDYEEYILNVTHGAARA